MSKCPHKHLKKQMVGEQVWYVCECGQKFRVEPWDGRVRLVEGLKVEEGREPKTPSWKWYVHVARQHKAADLACGGKWVCGCGPCCYAREAAQHLKREQEPAPVEPWAVGGGGCNFYFGGFDGGHRCQKLMNHDGGHLWEIEPK